MLTTPFFPTRKPSSRVFQHARRRGHPEPAPQEPDEVSALARVQRLNHPLFDFVHSMRCERTAGWTCLAEGTAVVVLVKCKFAALHHDLLPSRASRSEWHAVSLSPHISFLLFNSPSFQRLYQPDKCCPGVCKEMQMAWREKSPDASSACFPLRLFVFIYWYYFCSIFPPCHSMIMGFRCC